MLTSTSAPAEAAALARLTIMADSARGCHSDHALRLIASKTATVEVIGALSDGAASTDALEVLLADLRDSEFAGACGALSKAVAGRA